MRQTTRRARAALLLLGVALLAAGCGSDGGDAGPGGSPSGGGTEIEISGLAFKPETLRVSAGAEVLWTNHDATRHTVTAGTPEMPGSAFDAELDLEGDEFAFTFDETGAFPFFCRVHPNGMRGEITVG